MNVDDRLSTLPDDIIHHILSFLDMRFVVQTSFLSTRWRYMWKSVSNLNFNLDFVPLSVEYWEERIKSFAEFVDRVLMLREIYSINRLCLSYSDGAIFDASRIKTWIIVALGRHVQELCLESYSAIYIKLPCHLFTSDIRVLELKFAYYSDDFYTQMPRSMCTTTWIKTLVLEYVQLPDANLHGELLLSYSNMKRLIIKRCDLRHIKILSICAPLLESLELVYLKTDRMGSFKLITCNPNLKSLKCTSTGARYIDYSLGSLSSLVSADVDIYTGTRSKDMIKKKAFVQCLMKVLTAIYNVQALRLSTLSIKMLQGYPDLYKRLPDLPNLRTVILSDWLRGASIDAILNFIQKLPPIKILVCDSHQMGWSLFNTEEDWVANYLFQRTFDHLITFEIWDPQGIESELKFLENLLKNAPVLKKLIIKITDSYVSDKDELPEFLEKLYEFPRASSSVSFSFREESKPHQQQS